MFEEVVRELTAKEQRALRLAIAGRRSDRRRIVSRSFAGALAMAALLCVLTLLASDERPPVIVAFWLATAVILGTWTSTGELRAASRAIRRYASAVRQNRAQVVRIASSVMAQLEEVEDEGACYAFELAGDRVVFVCGQEFYPSGRFPNSDFSLVHIRDEQGSVVDFFIEKHGTKLRPTRTIPAAVKEKLRWPEHLEVVPGRVASLESCLDGRAPPGVVAVRPARDG